MGKIVHFIRSIWNSFNQIMQIVTLAMMIYSSAIGDIINSMFFGMLFLMFSVSNLEDKIKKLSALQKDN